MADVSIQDAVRSALVARLNRDPDMETAVRTLIFDIRTDSLEKATRAKERAEERWDKRQGAMTAFGLTPAHPSWVKAQESHDATIAAWDAQLNSIPAV